MNLLELVSSDRERMRTGHYAWLIIIGASAVFIADNALGDPKHGSLSALHYVTDVCLLVFVWALYCDFVIHSRRLCERCLAASPLDPQASVQRWRPFLKLQHGDAMKYTFLAVVLWTATLLFIPGTPRWTYDVQIAIQAAIIFWVVIGHWHSKLQPWCPWCHWDDGGDEEVSPDVPDPAISK